MTHEEELDALCRSVRDLCEKAARCAEAADDHKRASWWHGRAMDFNRYLAELERERAAARAVDRG